jgi:multiple sugar transport system ATP-binding protein
MSVYENIGFSMKLAKVGKAEADRRVRDVAKTLELTPLLNSKPAHLSGGQRQRVAMGRAMVREPAAFLMDEPLSNLDAKLRVQMRAEIARLQRSLGVTTIYVTHDQIEAMTMGERVAVLKAGVLQQVDTPKNLYDRPVNAFVAGFIGSPSMNLFEAHLSDRILYLGTHSVALTDEVMARNAKLANYSNQSIIVGIRPEHMLDAAIEPPSDLPIIPATVTAIEELGAEHVAHINVDARRVDSGDPDAVEEIGSFANAVARFSPRSPAKANDIVQLMIDIDHLHFFDHQTHRSI